MKTETIWQKLQQQAKKTKQQTITSLFDNDENRYDDFCLNVSSDLLLDFSNTNISRPTRCLLLELAEECQISAKRDDMFKGKKINYSENRAALHTALRCPLSAERSFTSENKNVLQDVNLQLEKMIRFCTQLHNASYLNAKGETFTDIVHLGVGGACLGNLMAVAALKDYRKSDLRLHFVSNMTSQLEDVLQSIPARRTLFIIASKSFATEETIANAELAQRWLRGQLPDDDINLQWLALTSKPELAQRWGIDEARIFQLFEWVGGRYSIFSAMGLTLMLAIGVENFLLFLQGAHELDQHFVTAELPANAPVMLALNSFWQHYFLNHPTQALFAYCYRLRHLPRFLQQLEMESNGKSIDNDGRTIEKTIAPIIFGDTGTDAQHSFLQYMHQAATIVPSEFFISAKSDTKITSQNHRKLLAHYLAQIQLLAFGNNQNNNPIPKYTLIKGNKPSVTILYEKLSPKTLGKIIALYEHKTFVMASLGKINCFDQWSTSVTKKYVQDNQKKLQNSNIKNKTKSVIDSINKMRHNE